MPFPIITLFFNILCIPISHSLRNPQNQLNPALIYDDDYKLHCNETCGVLQTHFPFYINKPSCGWSEPIHSSSNTSQFQLLCVNSSTLYLNIDARVYRVLEFYANGILVDFPGFSTICRPYNDLNSFGFHGFNPYLSISSDNVIALYDCDDSSLCKANCEGIDLPGCNNSSETRPSCCYPLSDHSFWSVSDDFLVFEKYDCRGFSSWAVLGGTNSGKHGVKLDWAVPKNLSKNACHANAHTMNSTTVKDGIRCVCDAGFYGDGFQNGSGCSKSCLKDGKDCESGRHDSRRKILILAGLFALVLAVASLAAFICLLKQSNNTEPISTTTNTYTTAFSFQKACRGRPFTLAELEKATNRFSPEAKLADLHKGSVFFGLLEDRARVAIHKVHCQDEKDLMHFLTQIEALSTILHRHVAQILGCCIDVSYTPMVVYEFPENGTLAQHITALDWYRRVTIAAETANTLASLQSEISMPVYHHNLNTSCIFLDREFSAKIACFELVHPANPSKSDVYDLGVVLLEILTGSRHFDSPAIALEKMRDGKLEEIVDPLLCFHDQPAFRKEEMEIMADVATRCLLFGGGARQGMLGMEDVARELLRVVNGGCSLEETFSNSSLLQMISMSPDSIYAPKK